MTKFHFHRYECLKIIATILKPNSDINHFLINCSIWTNEKKKKRCSRSSDHKGKKKKSFLFLYPETLLALCKTALLCPLTNGFIFSYSEFIISTQTCSLTPSQSLSHLKAVTYIIHKDNRKYAESYRHVMERLTCIRSKFHVLHGAYDSPINFAAWACLHPQPL